VLAQVEGTIFDLDAGPHRARLAERDPGTRTAGCSNGPTEAINPLIKQVKRVGHGFRNFANYRPPCC
jgi:hypothetical protein